MFSNYTNLFFPFCSFVVSITIFFVFFSKKKINTKETSLYSKLVITGVCESFLYTIICFIAHFIDVDSSYILYAILNKSLYIIYIIWFTLLFKYIMTVYISNREKTKLKNLSDSILAVIDIIFITLITILKVEIFFDPTTGQSNSFGYSANALFVGIGIYILAMIFMAIADLKNKTHKKYIPLYLLIALMVAALVIRVVDPLFSIYSNVLSLVVLVMFFTIENPDLQMLEEVHKAKKISDSANEEKALFLYNMTNEIRGITKDIDNSADAILDETDNKKIDIEFINDKARDIKGSTSKFTTMTNEILDVSRVDTASIKVYNEKYNIKLLIRQLVTSYKTKCEEKGLSFRNNIDLSLPEFLYGDSVNLKKVLDIILDNSYKYTDKGYIELNVNTVTKNDIVRLVITIEDSGSGMKAEDLNRILNTRKEDIDSTNLNSSLYNAKKLITLMGGTILPSSNYGKGTIIKIILDQRIFKKEEIDNRYNKELQKWKILLVDDNKSSQKLMKKLMTNTNVELDIVSLGKECLDKIRSKEKYDLILLDEEMKPLDGITVMKKLGEIRNFNTKVILLTRNNNYEYNDDYLKYGFADYILKPLTKEKILEKMGKLL